MEEENRNRIDPASLGIQEPGMTPAHTIRMEGFLYRSIATRDKHRKWWERLVGIVIGMMFLTMSVPFWWALFVDPLGILSFPAVLLALFELLFAGVGIKMLWANL